MTGDYRADGGPLSAGPPLTTEKGDAELAVLLKGRTFANSSPSPCHGRIARPEYLGIQGGGSSLTGAGGGGTGRRHGDGTSGRWGQR